jgi:cysteine-S-conjugate beta-lyase
VPRRGDYRLTNDKWHTRIMGANLIKIPAISELLTRRSEKWRAFPNDVLPLPVAEMDFPVAQPIREVLLEMINNSDLGYLGNIPEMGPAFAGFAQRRWNWTVNPGYVRVATDVGVAVVELLRVFAGPKNKVLISSPVYQNFYTWINETKVEMVDVPFLVDCLASDGTGWSHDWDGIEKAYADGISVHLICSPHNPLGKVYSSADLRRIIALAKKYKVIVISDEIHAPLTFKDQPFIPLLSLGDDAADIGVSVTAASKGWNIAGLKCAIVISQSDSLHNKLNELPPAMHYRASLLGAFATVAAFEKGEAWLDAALEILDENRHLISKLISTKVPAIGYRIPHSSYLAWLDLSNLNLGEDPGLALIEKAKVAFNSGHIYGQLGKNHVRLNFATSPAIITEAIERIARVL